MVSAIKKLKDEIAFKELWGISCESNMRRILLDLEKSAGHKLTRYQIKKGRDFFSLDDKGQLIMSSWLNYWIWGSIFSIVRAICIGFLIFMTICIPLLIIVPNATIEVIPFKEAICFWIADLVAATAYTIMEYPFYCAHLILKCQKQLKQKKIIEW